MVDTYESAQALVEKLLSDPDYFSQSGCANVLLKAFQRGFPKDNLFPLLDHSDPVVVRGAIWIGSELPDMAPALLLRAVKLLGGSDRYIRYYALDIIALGAIAGKEASFSHVVRSTRDIDPVIAEHSRELVLRASLRQISVAKDFLHAQSELSPYVDIVNSALAAARTPS